MTLRPVRMESLGDALDRHDAERGLFRPSPVRPNPVAEPKESHSEPEAPSKSAAPCCSKCGREDGMRLGQKFVVHLNEAGICQLHNRKPKAARAAAPPTMRRCSTCGEDRPLATFKGARCLACVGEVPIAAFPTPEPTSDPEPRRTAAGEWLAKQQPPSVPFPVTPAELARRATSDIATLHDLLRQVTSERDQLRRPDEPDRRGARSRGVRMTAPLRAFSVASPLQPEPTPDEAEDRLHAHVRDCAQCWRARHVSADVPAVAIGRDRMCEDGRLLSVAFVNALVMDGSAVLHPRG